MKTVIIEKKGYIHDKIPEDVYKKLISSLNLDDISAKNDNASNLAGNIETEKKADGLIPPEFYNYLMVLVKEYLANFFQGELSEYDSYFKMKGTWINYQKKYEFNPVHSHGGDFSFVVWIKIPYDVEEELLLSNSRNSKNPRNSLFCFISELRDHPIKVSKEMEGEIIIFDSHQSHVVYPFYTSDDYRISLSGNIEMQLVKAK